eukprot:gene20632-22667_t
MEGFFRSPLVVWVQQTFHREKFNSVQDILKAEFLSQVLNDIDPMFFGMLTVQKGADLDLNIQVQNLDEIIRCIKRFYQEKLQQFLVMKVPDILAIAKETDGDFSLEETKKILLIILGCAVQCEKKEYFIEKIKEMDIEVQTELIPYIQEITESNEIVLSYRINEIADFSQDQMVNLTESMYFQVQRLIEERDEYYEAVLDMNLERHEMVAKETELDLVRSPPMSPTRSGSIKTAVVLKANKHKIRDLQNDLEERNLQITEFKDEIANLKTTIENIRQENKSLLNEARWVKTYRDEMDVLKSQVDKVNKLESENAKYREKLRELDFYKKRFEELKEQHELLYETKLVLEEQVAATASKVQRVGHLEEENDRLHSQLKIVMEEREENQVKIKELMDENSKLQMEKQEGMIEIASLNQKLSSLIERNADGHQVPLSLEYKESSSTEFLRLEKENKHLMKLVESLREGTPRVRELEKQIEDLEDNLEEHKKTIANLNGELEFERSKAGELAGVATSHVDQIHRLKSRLSQKSMKVDDLHAELAKKGMNKDRVHIYMDDREDEDNNNGLNGETARPDDSEITIRNVELEGLKKDIYSQQAQIESLEARLKEEKMKYSKVTGEISEKENEFNSMESRAKEFETYSAKIEEQLKQREKDISELERRFENKATENKSLTQSVRLKDDKIIALEERVTHLLDSASQDTRKVNQTFEEKLKVIRELQTKVEKLQEEVHDHEKLKSSLRHRDEKLSSLIASNRTMETQIHELELQYEKSLGSCKKLDHALKLKNERILALEASLNEVESASSKQQEERLVSLKRALDSRSEELVDLEARMEEIISLNNKLKSSNRAKDDRIQALEDELSKFEESSNNEDKVEVLTKRLQKKADDILSLETSLEETTSNMKKYQRNSELKEEKIQQLEKKLENLEDSSGQKEKLATAIEDKNNKITELQADIDELNAQVRRLELTAGQKEERYLTLEKSLVEMEDSMADQGKLSRLLAAKEKKILSQQQTVDEKENKITQLENDLEMTEIKLRRLTHNLKLKEEQLEHDEERIEELNELQSQRNKLTVFLSQKDERITSLEEQVNALSDLQRINERLKDNMKQKEDKILGLEERINDLEDVVHINDRLNHQVHQKDERISVLQTKIHDVEDALHRSDQLRTSLEKNSTSTIQDLRRQVDELMDVKVKRQLSIRRREEKIMSLESRLEDVSSDTKHKDSKIQDLQQRLEGTMTQFRKLDLTNDEKDEKIKDLEARITELQNTYKENRQLRSLVQLSEEKIKELNKKVNDEGKNTIRMRDDNSQLEAQLSSLQQRLDETLSLNNKLNHSLKKQEEKYRELERLLQAEEDKNEVNSDQLLSKERIITRQKSKIDELESAIMEREKDLSELETRINHLTISDDNKSKAAEIMKEKDFVINNLRNRIASLESSAATIEAVALETSKEKDERLENLQKRLSEGSTEKHKLKLTIQEKDGVISDLERRIQELQLTKTDSDKMNHILNEKNSQIKYLRENLESYEKDTLQLETRYEGVSSDLNRAKGSIKQKVGRITSLKSQLEEAVSKNHNLANELGLRKEKIASLEKSLSESQKKEMRLKEELDNLAAQLEELRQRIASESPIAIKEKIQFTKRASDAHSPQASEYQDGQRKEFEDQIELLKMEKSRVMGQNEALSAKNASLQTENESLRSELDLLRSDYEIVQEDMNEAKEHYKDLDVSATKIAHRCEVLVQLNGTLEEENRALMDQVNKLLAQNQELLVKTLESRDTFLEDERAFSDRLYMLEREKEKLMDKVDAANKALVDHSNTGPKKKNLFVRGARKIMKKTGMKKTGKKEDNKNGTNQQHQRSPDGTDLFSDTSDSSSFSPSHERDDAHSLHSSVLSSTHSSATFSPSFGPIRTALSRSKQDLHQINDVTSSPDPNVLRRPKGYALQTDSPASSGSESGGRRARPRSEFIAPSAIYRVPVRTNVHRPHSMLVEAQSRSDGETRRNISLADHDEDNLSLPHMRKESMGSTKSSASNPSTVSGQNEVAFSVTGYRGEEGNSPVQRVRVTKRLITQTPVHVRDGSNLSQEDGEIVVYTDAKPIEVHKTSFQSEANRSVTNPSQGYRKVSTTSSSNNTTKSTTPRSTVSSSNDMRSDGSASNRSPMLARNSLFYQPTGTAVPNELPEADQRTLRKEQRGSYSGNNNNNDIRSRGMSNTSNVSTTSNFNRQRPHDVSTTTRIERGQYNTASGGATSDGTHANATAGNNHEKARKKTSWYDFGAV